MSSLSIEMRVIAKRTLREFWNDHPDAEEFLKAWYFEVNDANWRDPSDIKARYGSASILKGNRVVFNICGNKYRLVARINYQAAIVFIRFIGTHKEYDGIKAEVI